VNGSYSCELARSIPAIQIRVGDESNNPKGSIVHLPAHGQLQIAGDGFDERTVRVIYQGSSFYVFREDLEEP